MMKKILPLILAATLALPLTAQASKTEPSKSSSASVPATVQEPRLELTEAELDAIIDAAIEEVNIQWTESDKKKREKFDAEKLKLARERDAWKTGAYVAGGAAIALIVFESVRALLSELSND